MKKTKRLLVMMFAMLLMIGLTYAEPLKSGDKVQEDSELIYYLDVIYDGKDKNGVESSDKKTADIYSGIINVSDKLPAGLTYKGVVASAGGTIGAVKRSDNSPCSGYVVGNKEGVKFENGEVKFQVNKLGAGCKLTIGIKTQTPKLNGKKRIDFYNQANASEKTMSINSNMVHLYMGNENATKYKVSYEFEGDVPGDVKAPSTAEYADGTKVAVAAPININGYEFSGWKADGITGTEFTMPAKDVVFKGSFKKKATYKLSYKIDGDAPKSYVVPLTKEYGAGDDAVIDSTAKGTVLDGYEFLGWTSKEFDLKEGSIKMPAKDVEIVGKFKRISYTVTYKYQGINIPAGAKVPAVETHYPGDVVKLPAKPTAKGYKFLGWYHSDNFEMPAENITIYGEWGLFAGEFKPTIKKEIIDKKDSYKKGDVVKFKITVKNTAEYPIEEVVVEENLIFSKFIANDAYEIKTPKMAQIAKMNPGEEVVLYSEYEVGDEDSATITSKSNVIGALAQHNYQLAEGEIFDKVTFVVANKAKEKLTNTGVKGSKAGLFIILSAIALVLAYIFRKKRA